MSFEADDRPDIDEVIQICEEWKKIDICNYKKEEVSTFFENLVSNFQKRENKPTKEDIK